MPLLVPPAETLEEFRKEELPRPGAPPLKFDVLSAMDMLNVFVLFKSVKPYWLGEGDVETELAR